VCETDSKMPLVIRPCSSRTLRVFQRVWNDLICGQGAKELAHPTDPYNMQPGLARIHDKINQKNALNQEVDYFGKKVDPAKMADLKKVRHDIHETLTNKFV